MSPIVDIRELTRRFDGLVAVDQATAAIDQGEIFGLIGLNGAGKSTLLDGHAGPPVSISAIWERDLGVLQRYLVSPAPRATLVLGKALSAAVRALSPAFIVYLLALVLGVGIDLDPVNILGVIAVIAIGSALFSTFSLIIACIVKTRERFMGIGQVLTMPIFFASNAIYRSL